LFGVTLNACIFPKCCSSIKYCFCLGLCKIVADKTPYLSVEEITRKVFIGPTRLGHPCFFCSEDIKLGNLTIPHGERIMFNSVEEVSGIMTVNCGVVRESQSHSFTLPLSQEGKFYECKDDQIYTLKEIAEWKIPKSRQRIVKFTNILNTWEFASLLPRNFDGCLSLTPIYEVQAVMKFRKDIVHILSDLDIEVKDVTDCSDINCFLQLLSMEDIFERTSKEFPLVAEIIEGPIGNQQLHSLLHPGKEVVIHKKCQATRILASEIRSDSHKRHFLIPTSYKGKSEKEQLHVVATKAFESPHEELFSVSTGDQFLVQQRQTSEVLYQWKKKVIDVLACEQILNDEYMKVLLPMYMEGGFVEVIHDKGQYQLSELCKEFRLPFNVKVSVRDLSIGKDVLAATPGLQLEEEITDSYLLISSLHDPVDSWEIPVYRLNMSVQLLSKHGEETISSPTHTILEEITEQQYYMVRRYENQAFHPPPRPPKKPPTPEPMASLLTGLKQSVSDTPRAMKVGCYVYGGYGQVVHM
uniref:CABIT domain-containing protein n=1 Tax=Sphenodon punctatus TaxID=8508 RepID=A0A8D0GS02_SPHPU